MKKSTFAFFILMTVSAFANTDSLVSKFPEFGVYRGVDAMGNECRVKVTSFHLQTFHERDTYRDITLETTEMKFEYLFFRRLTNGKGRMERNSLYNIHDEKTTYRYSHFAPDASFRRSGRFLDWDRVLRSTAEIDLNDKRILKIKYKKTYSFDDEKEVTCSNLERLPKFIHLKETMDIVNQSLSIAYSNLGKYYKEEDKLMQRLLRTQKAIESYLIQLNNGTDPDTIIQNLHEASRHIHYLKVVLNQTAYVTGYLENAYFTLEDFFTYSN